MTSNALELVVERKIAELIPPPKGSVVLEASGVFAKGRDFFVVFDNIRRVARIERELIPESPRHAWLGTTRSGEGYEDIAYSPHLRRFYLLIEAEKHPDGTYKAQVDECDEAGRFKQRSWVDVSFEERNRGFEGLAALRWRGRDYLLALCEGNSCRGGRKARQPGRGRLHLLEKKGAWWQSSAQIKLPRSVRFEDYAAVSLRGNRIAIISQQTSRLWIGTLRRGAWTIAGDGRIYDFPRTKKGKRLYCTAEGLCWLSPSRFVVVSDLAGDDCNKRCRRTDQSVHIFRLPRGR